MARRNQKQHKAIPGSRAHSAHSQATTDADSTIHICAEDVCKDSAGGNAAVQAKIGTEDKKERDHLVPSSTFFNMESVKPRGNKESLSHVISNSSTLSDSGFREGVHYTPTEQASQTSLPTSEAPSAPTADEEEARAGQLKDAKEHVFQRGEAAPLNRANESGVPDDQAGAGDRESAHTEADSVPVVAKECENIPLRRGQRNKKPSLRAQEAAQAAQKEAAGKKKAGVPTTASNPQQSRKRKRQNGDIEGARRGKRKQNSTRTSTGPNDYSLNILFAVAVAKYFEVYERPELREAAAQGLLGLSEKAIVSA